MPHEGPADWMPGNEVQLIANHRVPRKAEPRYRGPEQHRHSQHYGRIMFKQTRAAAIGQPSTGVIADPLGIMHRRCQ
jgi:hypothetical protein